MSNGIESKLIEKLDVLIKLTALNLLKDEKLEEKKIRLLSEIGLRPKEIADILGKTQNAVNVTLSKIRKEKSKEKF